MPENISSQFHRLFSAPIEDNRSVETILERDSIPSNLRWEGMHVYVSQDGEKKTYELRGGIGNENWEPISDINLDVAVDIAFSETSTNPVQNQVITNGMYQRTQLQTSGQAQVHWNNLTNVPDLVEQSDLNDYQLRSEKGQINGYPSLNASGVIPSSQLPPLAITETFVVASQAAMLALDAQEGDIAVRTDLNNTFILQSEPASTLGNWVELLTPGAPVQSVNGETGTVQLDPSFSGGQLSITGSSSVNLDSRYYTETETDGLLNNKADKSTQVIAGTWLSGGGDLSGNRTINLVPTVSSWLNDSQGNERVYFGSPNTSLGVLLKASATGQEFQYRDVNNNPVWTVGDNGVLNTGIVPWQRLSGYPSIIAGSGLSGGGDLSNDLNIEIDNEYLDEKIALSPRSFNYVNADTNEPIFSSSIGQWNTHIRELGNVFTDDNGDYILTYSGDSDPYTGEPFIGYLISSDGGNNWIDNGQITEKGFEDPYLVKISGEYFLYTEKKNGNTHEGINLHKGTTLSSLTDLGVVIGNGTSGRWDSQDRSSPTVYVDDLGNITMFFEGRASGIGGHAGAIGYGTSTDGENFNIHPFPIAVGYNYNHIDTDSNTYTVNWASHLVCDHIMLLDGKFYLTFHGYNGTSFAIGMASSTDLTQGWGDELGTWLGLGKKDSDEGGNGLSIYIEKQKLTGIFSSYNADGTTNIYKGYFAVKNGVHDWYYEARDASVNPPDATYGISPQGRNEYIDFSPTTDMTWRLIMDRNSGVGVVKTLRNVSDFIVTIEPDTGVTLDGSTGAMQIYPGEIKKIISSGVDTWITFSTYKISPSEIAGFGLSWNSSTNQIDWGEYRTIGTSDYYILPVPDNSIFSLGDIQNDEAAIFVSNNSEEGTAASLGVSNSNGRSYFTSAVSGGSPIIEMSIVDSNTDFKSIHMLSASLGIQIVDDIDGIGLIANNDFSSNYSALSYVQKTYVDQAEYLKSLPNYNATVEQVLGHDVSGNLTWINN